MGCEILEIQPKEKEKNKNHSKQRNTHREWDARCFIMKAGCHSQTPKGKPHIKILNHIHIHILLSKRVHIWIKDSILSQIINENERMLSTYHIIMINYCVNLVHYVICGLINNI